MKYLVTILLPTELSQKLAKIQRLYKSERWNIALPPHITLTPPAKLLLDEKNLIVFLSRSAKKFQPFEIKISGVGKFTRLVLGSPRRRNHGKTIFAKVKESPELFGLQQNLLGQLRKYLEIENNQQHFRPHITLSNQLTPSEAKDKLASIQKLIRKQNFLCQKISLFCKSDNARKYQKLGDFGLVRH